MTTPRLPAGWRVESLGLIGAVQFTHASGRSLLWCDGAWTIGPNAQPAPGVPSAGDMAAARRVGTTWITEVEAS